MNKNDDNKIIKIDFYNKTHLDKLNDMKNKSIIQNEISASDIHEQIIKLEKLDLILRKAFFITGIAAFICIAIKLYS